jgi:hypothetical protein
LYLFNSLADCKHWLIDPPVTCFSIKNQIQEGVRSILYVFSNFSKNRIPEGGRSLLLIYLFFLLLWFIYLM